METSHELERDGCTIAYRRARAREPGGLPPLVLIHGAASNMTRWTEFVERTEMTQERDVVRLDLRGHADSVHRGRCTLEIWSDDLAAILDREGFSQAIVAGHCLGANVAATFAAREPDRTAGLVLIQPMFRDALTGSLHRLKPYVPLLRTAIALILAANRLGLYRRRIASLDLRELDREFRETLRQPGGEEALVKRYASPFHDFKTMASAGFLQDLVEVLRPLPGPTARAPFLALLSTGATFADVERTRAALRSMGDGETRLLSAQHWIPTEQPEEMRSCIEGWLRATPRPSRPCPCRARRGPRPRTARPAS